MDHSPRKPFDDRYLIVYRQPDFSAPGAPVPLSPAAFRQGQWRISDVDLPGFGDCAMPGDARPLSFATRPAAEAFLQRCFKAWGRRPNRGDTVPAL